MRQRGPWLLPLGAAGVGAGGALLTGVPEGPGLGAVAVAAHAAAPAAAQLPVVGQARGGLRGAVAVVSDVAGVALALPAVALPVAWTGEDRRGQRRGSFALITLQTLHTQQAIFFLCV